MLFIDDKHSSLYRDVLTRMKKQDCYHKALAYLITLDLACRDHINDIYDFDEDIILFDGLNKGWQTDTSIKTTLLAFNLWCSYIDEVDKKLSAPDNIFNCSYAPYYYEAIELRFERK